MPHTQADEEGSLEALKSLWLLVTPGWCRLSRRSVGCTSPPQFQADSLVSPFLSPSQVGNLPSLLAPPLPSTQPVGPSPCSQGCKGRIQLSDKQHYASETGWGMLRSAPES